VLDGNEPSQFTPYGQSYLWIKELLYLHLSADIMIAGAFFSIAAALVYCLRKRPDIQIKPIFLLFAASITVLGLSHLFAAWAIWNPHYFAYGLIKALTALVAGTTALYVWKGMPHALIWPSPAQLQQENDMRVKAHNALRQNETLLRGAFDFAPIGKALVSLDGRWLKTNQALCRILGYTEEELLKLDFQAITYPDDLPFNLGRIQDLMDNKTNSYEIEKRYIHKQGHQVWVLLTVTLVRDDEGAPQYFISQIQDITDRKRAEEELLRLNEELEARVAERTSKIDKINRQLAEANLMLAQRARLDDMTGLANRRHMLELVAKGIHASERYGLVLTMVMIDIDHFKSINDQYGHVVGDRVLTEVGRVIRDNTRDTDICARLGGDEFCLVLVADIEQAMVIATKLREQIESLRFTDGAKDLRVTCSMGLHQRQPDENNIEHLIANADKALYKAKRGGRNQVQADV
jgi:diguanylate cyclase (GGDEF)-like protein/PAS domain S-box-containing protein